jgi:hypothetical protein
MNAQRPSCIASLPIKGHALDTSALHVHFGNDGEQALASDFNDARPRIGNAL